jgi:nicotinamidase-related amidase
MSVTQPKPAGLRFGPISRNAVHLCVDMQRMFHEDTLWKTPWMDRVLPRVRAIAQARPADTVFTRFIPPEHPGERTGVWATYWTQWIEMTRSRIGGSMVGLVPDLAALCPPAAVIDKVVYSPWLRQS